MATEVGVGFVRLVPSMRGFENDARRLLGEALSRPAQQAGRDAGDNLGEGLRSGADSGAQGGADAALGKFSALKGGLAAIGLAAGAALAAGLSEALDQSRIVGKLQAQLGATPAEAEKIGKVAGSLYANAITQDFQGAADTIKATMTSGLLPPDATNAQIESMSTKVADLANTFDQDLGGVTNAVSQMLRTGLASSADEAFDVLTKGFQTSANKADDLVDTFNEYGTQFRKAGLDGATAVGLMNQAILAGARDSDIAADAIKEFSIRAIDGSEATADGFQALGLNADEMAAKFAKGGTSASSALDETLDKLRGIEDPVKQSQAAVALFGTQAEDLGDALLAMDPSNAVKSIGDVAGAADKMGDALRDNAGTKVEAFKRGITQGFVEFLGGTVIPAIEDFKRVFAGAFEGIDFAGFVEQVRPAFDTIKGVIEDIKTTFADMAAGSGMSMTDIRTFIEQTMTQVGQIITAAVELIKVVWDKWGEDILNVIFIVWDAVSGYVQGALQFIRGIIKTVTALIKGDWSGVWDGIKMILGGAWKAISSLLGGALKLLRNQISMALTTVTTWFRNFPRRILSALGNLGSLLYDKGRDLVHGLWNGIKSMGSWLRSQLTSWATSQIPGPIADALGIGSPSKVMAREIGRWIPAGVVEGWRAGLGDITKMADLTATAAMPVLPAGASTASRGGAASGSTVVINGQGLNTALLEWLRHAVRTEGFGSVQTLLEQRS